MERQQTMNCYTGFAAVYDIFMDNVPYEKWHAFLLELLQDEGIFEGLVLDLGCGTGNMTELLANSGYDMIGIDNSQEMLAIAESKRQSIEQDKERSILYLLQDMRTFELYGTVKAVISVCDSVNYITKPEELVEVFRLVSNYLDPGGIFIFDFNTEYKYRETLGDKTFAESREDCCFIWDNYYDEDDFMNECELNLFVRDQNDDKGRYHRFQEIHLQRSYTLLRVKNLLFLSGLEFVAAYDDFSKSEPANVSERILVVAREQRK